MHVCACVCTLGLHTSVSVLAEIRSQPSTHRQSLNGYDYESIKLYS